MYIYTLKMGTKDHPPLIQGGLGDRFFYGLDLGSSKSPPDPPPHPTKASLLLSLMTTSVF